MTRREFFKVILGKGTPKEKINLEASMSTTENFTDFADYVATKVNLSK